MCALSLCNNCNEKMKKLSPEVRLHPSYPTNVGTRVDSTVLTIVSCLLSILRMIPMVGRMSELKANKNQGRKQRLKTFL